MHCSLEKSTLLYLSAHCSRVTDTSYKLVSLKDTATIFQNVILEIYVGSDLSWKSYMQCVFRARRRPAFLDNGRCLSGFMRMYGVRRGRMSRRRRFFDKRESSAKWVGRNLPCRYRRKIRQREYLVSSILARLIFAWSCQAWI